MTMLRILLFSTLIVSFGLSAQMLEEDVDEFGVRNGMDFSWRYYQEQMERFPERLGIICYNAYLLDKVGLHKDGEQFMLRCADYGSTSAMIYLALLYEQGFVGKPDQVKATGFIRQAAALGNAVAQYHYGIALINGKGVEVNKAEGMKWLKTSANQGEPEAIQFLSASK